MKTRKMGNASSWAKLYKLLTVSSVSAVWVWAIVFAALLIPSKVNALSFTYSGSFTAPTWGGQGLESDGTNLFYLGNDSKIYTLNGNNGQVTNSFSVPINVAGLGLAYNGTSLFAIDSSYAGTNGTVSEINPSNGNVINSFSLGGQITAATFFNGNLYVYDGQFPGLLRVLDPSNGAILNSYSLSSYWAAGGISGLTTYGTSLIGAVSYLGDYVELDPYTGATLSSFTLPFSLTPNQGVRGLASDGTRLFATAFDYSGTNPGVIDIYSPYTPAVPEPATFILLISGLVWLVGFRKIGQQMGAVRV